VIEHVREEKLFISHCTNGMNMRIQFKLNGIKELRIRRARNALNMRSKLKYFVKKSFPYHFLNTKNTAAIINTNPTA
jgi:hypothetical protein